MNATEMQRLEADGTLRVKFQNVRPDGQDYAGSQREYPFFWENLPDGWVLDGEHAIEAANGPTIATALRSDDGEVLLAVEHETGLELIVVPILSKVASAAAVAAVEWAWNRWRKRRADLDRREALEPFAVEQPPRSERLRVHRVIDRDGTRTTETIEVDNPTQSTVAAALQRHAG